MPSRLFPYAFLLLFGTISAENDRDLAYRLANYNRGLDASPEELTLVRRGGYDAYGDFRDLLNRAKKRARAQLPYLVDGTDPLFWPGQGSQSDVSDSKRQRLSAREQSILDESRIYNSREAMARKKYREHLNHNYLSKSFGHLPNYPGFEAQYREPPPWYEDDNNNHRASSEIGDVPLKQIPVYPEGYLNLDRYEVPEQKVVTEQPFTYSVPTPSKDETFAFPPNHSGWKDEESEKKHEEVLDTGSNDASVDEAKTSVQNAGAMTTSVEKSGSKEQRPPQDEHVTDSEGTKKEEIPNSVAISENTAGANLEEVKSESSDRVAVKDSDAGVLFAQRRAKNEFYVSADDQARNQEALVSPVSDNSTQDVYFIAVVAGCSAAAMFILVLVSLTWCRLQRGAKAAADVEYPAYGVTGPNKDTSPSGDRRLAQSAQMYHYQHQKQQIIAMESRNATAREPGSLSEAESDEENEEGDYTVYECPGLAPTGEMEVKNPLFHDDPTPATPCQAKRATDNV